MRLSNTVTYLLNSRASTNLGIWFQSLKEKLDSVCRGLTDQLMSSSIAAEMLRINDTGAYWG